MMAIDSLLHCRGESCFLWTFTVPSSQPPRETSRCWSLLQRYLVRKLHFQGVRVFELHPGGHGLHVHAVTPFFYDVNRVRDITTRFGFGRIHVKRIPVACASYVAKYLAKDAWRPYRQLRGMRLWGCVGRDNDWCGVSVKNLVYFSPSQSIFRSIMFHIQRDYLDNPQIPFNFRIPFRSLFRLGRICSLASCGLVGVHLQRTRFNGWLVRSVPFVEQSVPCLELEVRF